MSEVRPARARADEDARGANAAGGRVRGDAGARDVAGARVRGDAAARGAREGEDAGAREANAPGAASGAGGDASAGMRGANVAAGGTGRTKEPAGARRTDVEALENRLGLSIDPELLVLALTHRSFAHEAGGIPTNERLEFLGDSVLGLVVTEHLYRSYAEHSEGDLARMRAATVSQRALAQVARDLELGEYVLLGRGELVTGGRQKESILADTVEALIGAAYLCHGLEPTRTMIDRLVAPLLARAAGLGASLDWKTSLQELAAALGRPAPRYEIAAAGPDHARHFTASVLLGDELYGTGEGSSKKAAELLGAQVAHERLEAEADDGGAAGKTARTARQGPGGAAEDAPGGAHGAGRA